MAQSMSVSDFKTWPRGRLQVFLKARGLPVTGHIDDLRSLAFASKVMGVATVQTPDEEQQQRCKDYRALLVLADGTVLPDPYSDLKSGWVREEQGMCQWPPTMYSDMAEYLIETGERSLQKRLMGDYKDGKAFSYFDSDFIGEVLFHPNIETSNVCFLKSVSARSQRRNDEAHKIWVALEKSSGKVLSGYCTCFAGLGATCNHFAGVLFKLDYAWQMGITNKACTSKPAEWTQPKKSAMTGATKMQDLKLWKPNWSKGKGRKPINSAARQQFRASKSVSDPTLEELMSDMYLSCKDACVFQYGLATGTVSYDIEDDVNVDAEVEVPTCVNVPPPLPELLKVHASSLPKFTAQEICTLVDATKGQSANSVWLQQRVGRITASVARSVMLMGQKVEAGSTNLARTVLDGILGRSSVPGHLPAIKYGQRMEPIARKAYLAAMHAKGHKGLTVKETGLHVMKDKIYMGASPDGLVQCTCCHPPNGLLEIKCPLSISHCHPQVEQPSYLVKDNGVLKLSRSHAYYSQVQMQMSVTNTTWCDFFVFTSHGHFLERIQADVQHQEQLNQGAAVVFDRLILPALKHVANPDSTESQHDDVQPSEPIVDTETSDHVDSAHLASNSPVSTGTTVASPDSSAQDTLPVPPPAKKRRVTGRRQKKAQKVAGPVYLCGICQLDCIDDVQEEADFSVGCDKCFKWFHWRCVGFKADGVSNDWYCVDCVQ